MSSTGPQDSVVTVVLAEAPLRARKGRRVDEGGSSMLCRARPGAEEVRGSWGGGFDLGSGCVTSGGVAGGAGTAFEEWPGRGPVVGLTSRWPPGWLVFSAVVRADLAASLRGVSAAGPVRGAGLLEGRGEPAAGGVGAFQKAPPVEPGPGRAVG